MGLGAPGIDSKASSGPIYFFNEITYTGPNPGGPGMSWVPQEYFGDVPKSMFTLFQIMTLDSWSGFTRGLSRDRKTGHTKTGYMEEAKTRI